MGSSEQVTRVMESWLAGDLYKWEAYALIREVMANDSAMTFGEVSAITEIPEDVLQTRMTELEAMREFLNCERMTDNARRVLV
jgi:hypothetical protein